MQSCCGSGPLQGWSWYHSEENGHCPHPWAHELPIEISGLFFYWTESHFSSWFILHIVKAMIFLVVMYGCESWTINKAERQRIDASELWCWRRFLRVPWTARKPNQSILKEISPEYSLEGLRLKLKFQYSGHLMRRANSLAKTLRPWCWERLKAEGDDRGRDGWMASAIQWTWVWVGSGSWGWTGKPGVLQSMGSQRVGHDWATKRQQ